MKTKISLCLLGLLSLGVALNGQAQQTTGSVEKTIAALEEQWTQALKTNNPDLVAPLLAEKMVSTGQDGTVQDKAAFLADSRTVKWAIVEDKDEKITVFGTTAIVTGELLLKGTATSGDPVTSHTRYTDVWVNMPNGKWQCVAIHEVSIAK